MRGLPKLESMPEAAPILIQVKQWCDNKSVIMEHFKAVTDDKQTRIQNMLILQTCPPSSTAGQQLGGSAADVPTLACHGFSS
jgi:hypothetical protein